MKVRRIDFYPDEYITGVAGVLNAVEQGVYWMICSLIMSEGDAVKRDDRRFAGLVRMRPSDVRKVVDRLIELGKISEQNGGKLAQKRAQNEVKNAAKRIQIAHENGSKGGRPSQKTQQNQQIDEPEGYCDGKTNYQLPTTNYQLEEDSSNELSSALDGDFAEWYVVYPLHKGRGRAVTAYRAARKKTDRETLLAGARDAATRYAGADPRFVPHPATWLNGERWLDEPPSALGRPLYDAEELEIYRNVQ